MGNGKVRVTLEFSREEYLKALSNLLERYPVDEAQRERLTTLTEIDATREAREFLYMPTKRLLRLATEKAIKEA